MKLEQIRGKRIIPILEGWIPYGSNVLDIGCGDGGVGSELKKHFNLQITGTEIYFPQKMLIPIQIVKGNFPYKDKEFDIALLIDVLHHVKDWKFVLSEARRVAETVIVYEVAISKILKIIDYPLNKLFFNPDSFDRPKTFDKWITEFNNINLTYETRRAKMCWWYPAENFAFKMRGK